MGCITRLPVESTGTSTQSTKHHQTSTSKIDSTALTHDSFRQQRSGVWQQAQMQEIEKKRTDLQSLWARCRSLVFQRPGVPPMENSLITPLGQQFLDSSHSDTVAKLADGMTARSLEWLGKGQGARKWPHSCYSISSRLQDMIWM